MRVHWLPPAVVVCASLTAVLIVWRIWLDDPRVVEENRLVESMQMLLLLAAFGVHGGRAMVRVSSFDTLVRTGLALFCLSLALREVDIDRLGGAVVGEPLELVLRGIVIVAWVIYAVRLVPRWDVVWRRRRELLLSWCGVLTLAGVVCYAGSWPFDKMVFPFTESVSQFVEEGVLQLNAGIFFVAAAVFGRPWGAAAGVGGREGKPPSGVRDQG